MSKPRLRLTIRCDGSAGMGLGHVMRGVALAQAAERCPRALSVRFAMREDAVANEVARAHGFAVDVMPRALSPDDEAGWLAGAAAGKFAAGTWVVVDGYHLDDLIAPLRARGARVCAVDDLPTGPGASAEADLLVNPSPAAVATRGLALGRRVLLGPRYAPVRRAFRCARIASGARRAPGATPPLRLLILSGGSDVAGLTGRVLSALRAAGPLPPLAPMVVLGPSAPDPSPSLLASKIELVRAPRDMAALMASADLAISAAGTSVLELASLGVPALMLTVVDNQAGVAAAVEAAGAGLDLGPCAALDARRLSEALHLAARRQPAWSAAARRLVDGGGARRVMGAIARLAAAEL